MVLPKVPRHTTIRGGSDNSALLRRFSISMVLFVIFWIGYIEYTTFLEMDKDITPTTTSNNRGSSSRRATTASENAPSQQPQPQEFKRHNPNHKKEDLHGDDTQQHEKEPQSQLQQHTIPHIIWQTSRSQVLPPEANRTVSTWRQLNPEYEYRLMDDDDIDHFFRTKFSSRIYQAFQMLPLGVMRADMWRVAVMYYYGGIYSDVDSIAVRPIDQWITSPPPGRGRGQRRGQGRRPDENDDDNDNWECEAYIGIESRSQFCNWAFAAVPHHPVFQSALDMMVEKLEHDGGVHPNRTYFVHDYTGPLMLTKALQRTLHTNISITDEIRKDPIALHNAKQLKLCLMNQNFFSRTNVMNSYASLHWNNSKHWGRWVQEKNVFFKEYQKNQTANKNNNKKITPLIINSRNGH